MLQCDTVGPRISVVPHFEVFYAMRSAVADALAAHRSALLSWCSRGGEMCSAFYYPSHYLIGRLHLLFHLIFLLLLKCTYLFFLRILSSCVTYCSRKVRIAVLMLLLLTLTRGRWVLINIFYIPRLNFFWELRSNSESLESTLLF